MATVGTIHWRVFFKKRSEPATQYYVESYKTDAEYFTKAEAEEIAETITKNPEVMDVFVSLYVSVL